MPSFAHLKAQRGRTSGSAAVSGLAVVYQHPPGVNTVHCSAAACGRCDAAASSRDHVASAAIQCKPRSLRGWLRRQRCRRFGAPVMSGTARHHRLVGARAAKQARSVSGE